MYNVQYDHRTQSCARIAVQRSFDDSRLTFTCAYTAFAHLGY